MKHPMHIKEFESLEILAKTVGNLRYDRVVDFLNYLAKDLNMQGMNDLERGRVQLSNKLVEASTKLIDASTTMNRVWEICKPHMKGKK